MQEISLARTSLRFILLLTVFATSVRATEITTNAVHMTGNPPWLTESRVNKVAQDQGNNLEWDIRKVEVKWVSSEQAFENIHHFGPTVEAFFRRSDKMIFLGPRVNSSNFDGIFGHELAHVIIFQKYHDAIPAWLEEGVANYTAKKGTVNYKWLAEQKPIDDVTRLTHPYGSDIAPAYVYQASTALVEMIASKCSLSDLLQLSVGKKLERYLSTYCEIKDLNGDFQKWIKTKGANNLKKP
jgi:hypothetical protein